MKREGRQHGMVRSYLILPYSPINPTPKPKKPNALDSRPTAGAYTRVSRKPTNHSKFTGKCGVARCTDCHINPGNKSRDKAKGTQKLNSCNVHAMNQRSLAWGVVGTHKGNGLNYDSKSASGILCDITGSGYVDDDDYCYYYSENDDEIEYYEEDSEKTHGVESVVDNCQVEEDEGWCVV